MTSDTTITATAPPGTNTVDVTVTTPSGTSAGHPADRFTYGRGALPRTGPDGSWFLLGGGAIGLILGGILVVIASRTRLGAARTASRR